MAATAEQPDLVVARILAAADLPGARAASYRLTLDLGPRGRREASIQAGAAHEDRDALVGRLVVCLLAGDETLVLAAQSHAHGLVFVEPEREVEPGTIVA